MIASSMKIRLFLLVSVFIGVFALEAQAFTIYEGEKYSIAGENTNGLCHLINKTACESQKTETTELESVLSGRVDLGSVLAQEIQPDYKLRVIMHLTSDQKYMLVSRDDFPEADAREVIKSIEDFLLSGRQRTQSRLVQEFVELPRIYGGRDPLEHFLKFDRTYPIHPGLADYILSQLKTPLKIHFTNSHALIEDYRASYKASFLGMGLVPFLEEALRNEDDYFVAKAANAMGRIKPHDSKIMTPMLLKLLDHHNEEVREQAVIALSNLEPIQDEAITHLQELANKEPVARDGFSDGKSHGMSETITVLSQESISQHAAYGLAKIATKDAIETLKSLVRSDSVNKQTVGIKALDRYFRFVRLQKERNSKMRNDLNDQVRDIADFLEKHQDSVSDENKKLAVNLINQFSSEKISEETIRAIIKDLYNDEHSCREREDGREYCEFNNMRQALYKLKNLGRFAARPDVLDGLKHVLQNGGPSEIELTYRLLSDLSTDIKLSDSLLSLMIEKADHTQREVSFVSLANVAVTDPVKEKKAISFLENKLNDSDKWTRNAAVKALTELLNLSKNNHDEISQKVINIVRSEQDPSVLGFMVSELGKLASFNDKAQEELFIYASYRQDLIDEFFESTKSAPLPRSPISGNDPNPINVRDVYSIRFKALSAVSKLDTISSENLKLVKTGFEKEIQREGCRHTGRTSYLSAAKNAYEKHSGSKSDLIPFIINALEREDDSKCDRSVLDLLTRGGGAANHALPILENRLNKHDLRKNGQIFSVVKSIDTEEAQAFLRKYKELDPSVKREQHTSNINLLSILETYFRLLPEIDNAEMHVIAVEHTPGDQKPGRVTVKVNNPDNPVILMLYGLEQISWTVKPLNQTQIVGIRFGGRELQIPENIPEYIPFTGYIGYQSDYSRVGGITGEYALTALKHAEALTGKETKTFQYLDYADEVVLDQNTSPKPPFSLGTHLNKVFDRRKDTMKNDKN